MPVVTMPWSTEAAWTRLLLHDPENKPAFHKVDVWHNMQLGQGKAFCASAMVSLLSYFEGSNVEARFSTMFDEFKKFCKARQFPHKKYNSINMFLELFILFEYSLLQITVPVNLDHIKFASIM